MRPRLSWMIPALLALCAHPAAWGADSFLIEAGGKQPRVAVAADGTVTVAYAVGDALKTRSSTDGGASYAEAVTVGEIPKLMVGMRRGPQIAAGATAVVVAGIGSDGDMLAWRSADRGASWSGPTRINDQPSAAREGLFALAAGKGDAIWSVWLDLREAKTRVYASRSDDGGQKWAANRLIYASPEGSVCECCQPTIAADGEGSVGIMWRNHLAGARDMYLSFSRDGGSTFSPAKKLGSGTWKLAGCPMDGGDVDVAGRRAQMAWRRDNDLYAVSSQDPTKEIALGPGRNPTVAMVGDSVVRAWQRDQEIVVARDAQPAVSVGRGSYPTLAASSTKASSCFLAWEADDGARVMPITP